MGSQFWKVFAFIICDVASVVVVPLLSCLLGGWIAVAMEFGLTVEVLAVILSIAMFSAALLWVMQILFEISYFSELTTRSSILNCLSAVNCLWLIVAVRQLVKVTSRKEGVILGATPFGFFLASLIFSCSKFVVYLVLFTFKLNKMNADLVPPNTPIIHRTVSSTSVTSTSTPPSSSSDVLVDGHAELRQRIFHKLIRRSESFRQPLVHQIGTK